MIPIKIATHMEISTHTVAIRRERVSFFSSSIAMKRSRMCGMPKYPRPHARVDTMVSRLYGAAVPVARS